MLVSSALPGAASEPFTLIDIDLPATSSSRTLQ